MQFARCASHDLGGVTQVFAGNPLIAAARPAQRPALSA